MKNIVRLLTLFIVICTVGYGIFSVYRYRTSPTPPANPVTLYLQGAEIQGEPSQTRNINQALKDMLTLTEQELRGKRYADYQGHPNRWTAEELLYRHVVPGGRLHLGNNFFHDVKAPDAQAAIRKLLYGDSNDAAGPPF